MEIIKKKYITYAVMAALGIGFMILSYTQEETPSFLSSYGGSFTVIAIAKLLQYYRLSKDPEKLRKFVIMQTEERLIFIVQKSAYLTLVITELAEAAAMVIFIMMDRSDISFVLSMVALFQILVYLVLYRIFEKKY